MSLKHQFHYLRFGIESVRSVQKWIKNMKHAIAISNRHTIKKKTVKLILITHISQSGIYEDGTSQARNGSFRISDGCKVVWTQRHKSAGANKSEQVKSTKANGLKDVLKVLLILRK